MAKPLDGQRILVTNDDGIHAPGLKALEQVARALSDDVWTVAPEVEQSAMSHALTTRRPLTIQAFGERRFAVNGTPSDCMVVGFRKVLDGQPPDLVLSGVNHGGNLAEDVLYSGTVAAAMEAVMLGSHAIAFSQVGSRELDIPFPAVAEYAPQVIVGLQKVDWRRDLLINVNFPPTSLAEVKGIKVTSQGRGLGPAGLMEGKDPGGRDYVWIGDWAANASAEPGSDIAAVDDGWVSVTPLHQDLTYREILPRLTELFA